MSQDNLKVSESKEIKDSYQAVQTDKNVKPNHINLVQTIVFPLVMYGSESWTIKKAECRRIDALVLWC